MSRVFINGVLTEVGQGADEIISLRRQLVESQAREAKLREALQKVADTGLHYAGRLPGYAQCALYEIPTDDTALREMIQRAGEVMRERCADVAFMHGRTVDEPIRAIPGVTLEDLK